jgi:hypothetical protein
MASEIERRRAAAALKSAQRIAAQQDARGVAAMRQLERQRRLVQATETRLQTRRREQTELMVRGRLAGLTWDDLAAASGVTRQAVQQRVGPLLDSSE